MNIKSTTHKAQSLGITGNETLNQDENSPQRRGDAEEIWNSGNQDPSQFSDEQLVLDGMMQCLRGMRSSERPGVVNAAREWERIINFRIQITMQERKRRGACARRPARVLKIELKVSGGTPNTAPETGAIPVKIISSPAGGRMRLSVSPVRN